MPRNVEIISERQSFLADLCKDKNVLHPGGADAGLTLEASKKENFLQSKIARVAKKVIGVDNDVEGIAFLK